MSDINFSVNFWNKLAAKYAKKPVPNEAIYQKKLKLTQQYLSRTDLVFEFGCGTGSTAVQHAPKVSKIEATDISPAMINIAKSRAQKANIPNITFEVGQIEILDLKPNTYNAVLGLNVMHLVDEPATTLHHICRVLKEDLKDSDKPYHVRSMSWAQRLKRVFNIDITICEACESNNVKIIACITQPAIINKILMHLDKNGSPITANTCRSPPLFESAQTTVVDDYTIQRDFDFGA